ncbi:MAG: hypothetical protein FWD68_02730 [Alphaproteobacteria bacterium]|nr:hypothetical protein [Alphaproteobacteria bacterium]
MTKEDRIAALEAWIDVLEQEYSDNIEAIVWNEAAQLDWGDGKTTMEDIDNRAIEWRQQEIERELDDLRSDLVRLQIVQGRS